jgi:hypothetical protein
MAEGKYWKNFEFNQSPDNPAHPFGSFDFTQMFDVSGKTIAGAPGWMFCAWFREPLPINQTYKPHVHGDDEFICYFGSNTEDPFDLGGEIELWIEDEPYNFTKSGIVWLPKGVAHCPWFIKKITSPILIMYVHTSAGMEGDYFVDDPKWTHLPATPEIDPDAPPPADMDGAPMPPPELVSVEEHRRRQKDNPWLKG